MFLSKPPMHNKINILVLKTYNPNVRTPHKISLDFPMF